ncbi:MAG: prepilin peptidase [Lachnospiraceae bacterium]|nr:prepilin peptidase [Lachnospiraceae bacterium]
MQIMIIHAAIYFAFYIMGAYATTDILRLLKGSIISVNDKECYCPVCHNRISLKEQIPIAAFIINRGRCRYCRSRIPVSNLFFEFFLFEAMSFTAKALNFSILSYVCCMAIYEGTKFVCLIIFGKREQEFVKNLICSVCNNFIIFIFLFCLFIMGQCVASCA